MRQPALVLSLGSGSGSGVPLTRIAHPPPRRFGWLIAAIGGALFAFALALVGGAAEPDCRVASETAAPEVAAAVCERAYQRTRDPEMGARLADAQRRTGNRAVAAALAHSLLATSARADALRVIGLVAASEQQLDTARRALEGARELHRAARRDAEAVQDDLALAGLGVVTASACRPLPIESPVRM
jgi:hypothetical protein